MDDVVGANSTKNAADVRVLLLGLGLGSDLILQSLLEQGLQLVVMDGAPVINQDLQKKYEANGQLKVIPESFSNTELVHEVVCSMGITHTVALPVGRALIYLGKLNDAFGFAGPSFAVINACTDKLNFHHFLEQHAIPDYGYMVLPASSLAQQDQASAIVAKLGLPLIVKPTEGSGSQGVRVVSSLDELRAYQVPERFAADPVLVEQMLVGTEYSTNVFVDDKGEAHLLGIFRKEISALPYRQEIAYFVDPDESEQIQHLILPVIQQITSALKLKQSFFHADCIITNDNQVFVIDCSPRMAGNNVILLERLIHANPAKIFVDHVLNQLPFTSPTSLVNSSAPKFHCAALRFFSFARTGKVKSFTNMLQSSEDKAAVIECINNINVGDMVGPMSTGGGIATGYIFVGADTVEEANALTLKYMSGFEVEY